MMSNQSPAGSSPKEKRPHVIRIEPSPRTILTFLVIIASLWVLNRLLPVILVLVVALIIVASINPAVQWLEARRVRRGMGIAIVFTALLVFTVVFVAVTIPALLEQAKSLLEQEPALRLRLTNWLEGSYLTKPLGQIISNVHSGELVKMAALKAI